jgi:hypothetical protein
LFIKALELWFSIAGSSVNPAKAGTDSTAARAAVAKKSFMVDLPDKEGTDIYYLTYGAPQSFICHSIVARKTHPKPGFSGA